MVAKLHENKFTGSGWIAGKENGESGDKVTSGKKAVETDDKGRRRKTTMSCLKGDGGSKLLTIGGWTTHKANIFRFVGLCLLMVVILCCAYGLKQDGEAHEKQFSMDNVYAVGDPVYAKDLWLIVEVQSDSRGRRTHLGQATAAHACAAIKAGQKIGWTPLLVGGKSRCCRSRCRHLHPADLGEMKHATSNYFVSRDNYHMAMKTAAFLAAIKRGAHFIFHSHPEVYYWAGISAEEFQKDLEHQLQKTTLGISVGLVRQFPVEGSIYFDPHLHFGGVSRTDDLEERHFPNNHSFAYKICEIRPPSVEKFISSDVASLDTSAPPLTLPGWIKSLFDSRNTVFGRDAFFSLLLLPNEGLKFDRGDAEEIESLADMYLIRSIITQIIVEVITGSTKFSILKSEKNMSLFGSTRLSGYRELFAAANQWACGEATAIKCYRSLVRHLIALNFIDKHNLEVIDLWARDLVAVGYKDIELLEGQDGSPCIGNDALTGVYFHPSVTVDRKEMMRKMEASVGVNDQKRKGKYLRWDDNQSRAIAQVRRLCPTVDASDLVEADVNGDLLLIITFYRKEYHNIPLLEILYRPHFKNILYCGEPDPIVEDYITHYNEIQGTHFSFLPAHTKTGYECLLGSIEMGYHVDGFLLINQDTLINSWNFKDLNPKTIWHGNEHATAVSHKNIIAMDLPRGDKVFESVAGIFHAFEFLESTLLANPASKHQDKRNSRRGKTMSLEKGFLTKQQSPAHLEDLFISLGERQWSKDSSRDSLGANHGRSKRDEDADESFITIGKELKLLPEESLQSSDQAEMEILSVIEDTDTVAMLAEKEWHISLFGEIIHDAQQEFPAPASRSTISDKLVGGIMNATQRSNHMKYRNVTDLLFHPSNFDSRISPLSTEEDSVVHKFSDMMFDIQKMYKRINSKLQLWMRFIKIQHQRSSSTDDDDLEAMKEGMSDVQCDVSTNAEICQIVAHFFNKLEENEADGKFKLYFDDLPIYYIPASHKDRLYLMANLFTKFQVADELAFPLLLRGLANTKEWSQLSRAELIKPTGKSILSKPQDLLLDVLDDIHSELDVVEAAHYLYPVDMKNEVFQNDGLRNIICRNF